MTIAAEESIVELTPSGEHGFKTISGQSTASAGCPTKFQSRTTCIDVFFGLFGGLTMVSPVAMCFGG